LCEEYFKKFNQYKEYISKCNSSFIVIRFPASPVYTCYFSGCINVTGVRCLSDIKDKVLQLSCNLNIDYHQLSSPKIDNITARYPKTTSTKLHILTGICKNWRKWFISIKHNRSIFPGLFLKTESGTLIWFNSGSIISVGSKSEIDLIHLSQLISLLKKEYEQYQYPL